MTDRATASGRAPELPDDASAPAPIDPASGQHRDHWILSEDERKKGFVRPVRNSYSHKECGIVTRMGQAIAETYARDPKFYGSTFCIGCKNYFPVSEFKWEDALGETVGS